MVTRAKIWTIGAILFIVGIAIGATVLWRSPATETMLHNPPKTPPIEERRKSPRSPGERATAVVAGKDRIGGDNLSEGQRQRIAALMKERDGRLNAIWADRAISNEEQQRQIQRVNVEIEATIQAVLQNK